MEYETEKKTSLESYFNQLGFTNTSHQYGFKPEDKYLTCGLRCTLPKTVGNALTQQYILKNNNEYPFLLLEADATPELNHFQIEFDVPDECDCIYLGTSPVRGYGVKWKKYNDNYYRIEGTLSSHAILYIKEEYAMKQLASIQTSLDRGIPFDVGYAWLQNEGVVLSPNKYFFYQNNENISTATLMYDYDLP